MSYTLGGLEKCEVFSASKFLLFSGAGIFVSSLAATISVVVFLLISVWVIQKYFSNFQEETHSWVVSASHKRGQKLPLCEVEARGLVSSIKGPETVPQITFQKILKRFQQTRSHLKAYHFTFKVFEIFTTKYSFDINFFLILFSVNTYVFDFNKWALKWNVLMPTIYFIKNKSWNV